MEIYLDNSATTRCYEDVAALVSRLMTEEYGNPSSMHIKGVEAERHIRGARTILSRLLKVNEKELIFTSGGTESDNLALIGAAMANRRAGNHIITTQIEHPAVREAAANLEEQGFRVTWLPVDACGVISIQELEQALCDDTILVSIMHVNNEVGSVQPVEEAGAVIKKKRPGALFHVDAVQSFGKYRIFPKRCGIDLLSVSSHKIHGPKGAGLLYADEHVKLKPILFGGGHQRGLRSGTENVPGTAGLARAAQEIYEAHQETTERLYRLKYGFLKQLLSLEDVRINGIDLSGGLTEEAVRGTAPHIISLSAIGVRSEVLLHALEEKGIYVSAGSACASNKPAVSATLKAMGLPQEALTSTIRISLSGFTTQAELDETAAALAELLPELRRFTRR